MGALAEDNASNRPRKIFAPKKIHRDPCGIRGRHGGWKKEGGGKPHE